MNNVSQNPSCETFSLIFDEEYDNNANMGETLELDIETCDLLPVIIDTSTWAHKKWVLFYFYLLAAHFEIMRLEFHFITEYYDLMLHIIFWYFNIILFAFFYLSRHNTKRA